MKRILVAPREGHQIGYELGECMTSLENAGIRDYSARLERYHVPGSGPTILKGREGAGGCGFQSRIQCIRPMKYQHSKEFEEEWWICGQAYGPNLVLIVFYF